MKIPFDIKYRPQIESGEYKVETKVGCPVRIVCWDMACELPILGLVLLYDEKAEEMAVGFTNEGTNLLGEPLYDKLFIVTPEEEMTEWERFISACLQKHGLLDCGAADRIAKKSATELLNLATKKLVIRQESYQDGYINGLHDGKAEALKDFPRWRKFEPSIDSPNSELEISKELANSVMRVDNMGCIWLLKREELTNLPKED